MEARRKMRNARAAAWFAVDRGTNLVSNSVAFPALAPSSLPITQVAGRFAAECGGNLIRPLRSRNTLQKRNQSASGVTKADATLRRVLRILTMLDARPEFINAAPSLYQQAKRRVAGRVLR